MWHNDIQWLPEGKPTAKKGRWKPQGAVDIIVNWNSMSVKVVSSDEYQLSITWHPDHVEPGIIDS